MSIKYVEDYRIPANLGDSATIQAAIDDLNDGDTLLFGNKVSDENAPVVRTYALDEPVYFTSYNGNSGILYKQDNSYNFSPSVIGTYVRVRYLYNVTSNSREIIEFYVVE